MYYSAPYVCVTVIYFCYRTKHNKYVKENKDWPSTVHHAQAFYQSFERDTENASICICNVIVLWALHPNLVNVQKAASYDVWRDVHIWKQRKALRPRERETWLEAKKCHLECGENEEKEPKKL